MGLEGANNADLMRQAFELPCTVSARRLASIMLTLRYWMTMIIYEKVVTDIGVVKFWSGMRANFMAEVKDLRLLKQSVSLSAFIQFMRENPDVVDLHDYMAYFKSDVFKLLRVREFFLKPSVRFFAQLSPENEQFQGLVCRLRDHFRIFQLLNDFTTNFSSAEAGNPVRKDSKKLEDTEEFVDPESIPNNFANYERHMFRMFDMAMLRQPNKTPGVPPSYERQVLRHEPPAPARDLIDQSL